MERTIKLILVSLMVSVMSFVSCSKDSETEVKLNSQGGDISITPMPRFGQEILKILIRPQ